MAGTVWVRAQMKRRSIARALMAGAALLVGCGGNVVKTIVPAVAPVATAVGTVTVEPRYSALGVGSAEHFVGTAAGGGGLTWSVNGIAGGNASLGTVDAAGNYTAPATLAQSENVVVTASSPASPQTQFATAVVSLIVTGVVSGTANPQVATYAMYLPMAGELQVEFGQSAGDVLPTWQQSTPTPNGGAVTLLVAGMRGSASYQMHAQVTLADGATFTDADHTFATGATPATPKVTAGQTGGEAPQPGIELFDTLRPHEPTQAFATDLSGNVIWTYGYTGSLFDLVQPVKLLPNGHFLVQISYASSIPVQKGVTVDSSTVDEVREVDLAGTTIRSLTQAQVASALTAQGYSLQLGSLHHDVLALPNGHMLLLFSVTKSFTDLPGYPGTTNVLGDALVDVDQNFNPDWVWNAFDHLDVNRHPFMFPDWTHSNALLYSADDHNVLLSVRHQNWIIKIDFEDGKGSGNILWRLGQGGDFQLQSGVEPTDWFYAQHGPGFFTNNTSGVFRLGIMDDGDDRQFPPGVICGAGGAAPCLYSSAPVLEVDEARRTATLVEHYVPPASMYSFFGGNVELLANGDLEADFCASAGGSVVQEVKGPDGAQQVVWQAVTRGTNQYRAFRMPSLYPGVQW